MGVWEARWGGVLPPGVGGRIGTRKGQGGAKRSREGPDRLRPQSRDGVESNGSPLQISPCVSRDSLRGGAGHGSFALSGAQEQSRQERAN